MRVSQYGPLAALLVAGCASSSTDISGSYISPIMYQNHTCAQLAQEAQAISARAAQASGAQDQQRTNDAIATGVAIVVFWPAAFFVGGNRQTAAELAQLKGQMTAIEQASIQKNCAIQFQRGASADCTPQPTISQVQPPPTVVQSKQAKGANSKSKQMTAPPPVIVQTPAEPPQPTMSEADRAMSTRN